MQTKQVGQVTRCSSQKHGEILMNRELMRLGHSHSMLLHPPPPQQSSNKCHINVQNKGLIFIGQRQKVLQKRIRRNNSLNENSEVISRVLLRPERQKMPAALMFSDKGGG